MVSSKVSVIVPVYNAEKTISACVNALLIQQAPGVDIEIIAVDDGSTDATSGILKTFDRVKYIYQQNAGPAAARNCGARCASGEVFLFTDSDCIPREDWVAKMLKGLDSEQAGAAAGSYGIANPQFLLARCVHQEILYRHGSLMGDWVEVFGSYNAAIFKGVFERVKGFDETYRFPSGEDNDLSYRLRQSGVKIRFVKDGKVDHAHPVSVRRYLFEQFRHGFWRVKMYKAFPGMMKGDGYTFWKDPLEMILTVLIAALVAAGFLSSVIFFAAALIASVLWLWFEAAFAVRIGLPVLSEQLFFAGVMFMRSWARSAGFFYGMMAAHKKNTNNTKL
jgi:glycosyltransferase involved in cell wall biosynthesis